LCKGGERKKEQLSGQEGGQKVAEGKGSRRKLVVGMKEGKIKAKDSKGNGFVSSIGLRHHVLM